MTINELPSPSPDHSSYLTDLLIKASKLHGMNHTERMLRIELVQKINESIKGHGLGITLTNLILGIFFSH